MIDRVIHAVSDFKRFGRVLIEVVNKSAQQKQATQTF
jgi:hypothetical protein